MFKRLFIDHPAAVNETFVEHGYFATRFAALLLLAAGAAAVHALVPGLCRTTASSIVRQLHGELVDRGRYESGAQGPARRVELAG